MYIVIVGGGKVGRYLTESLMEAGHEVLVIEKDTRKCSVLSSELGAQVLQRDGCEVATMAEAGMGRANTVIAVTGDDEDNLIVCQVAKRKFNVSRAIARINNPKNEAIFHRLGIDVTVSSTNLILSQIEQSLPAQSLVHLLTLRRAKINLVELEIAEGAPSVGKPLSSLGIPDDCILTLVVRNGGDPIIPYGDTVLEVGDQVIAVTSIASEATLRWILCG